VRSSIKFGPLDWLEQFSEDSFKIEQKLVQVVRDYSKVLDIHSNLLISEFTRNFLWASEMLNSKASRLFNACYSNSSPSKK